MKLAVMICFAVPYWIFQPAFAENQAELEIEATYNNWVETVNDKDMGAWSSYLAPNAKFLPPGIGELNTHEAIRNYYLELFADPNFALNCKQLSAVTAESGNFAWSTGECEATSTGNEGELVHSKSKWAKVWEKQSSGTWKCKLNIWNGIDI